MNATTLPGVPAEELAYAPVCAGPDPRPKTPSIRLPKGATDCHAHVFGPSTRYRYAKKRIYTPPDALPSAYRGMLDTLGVERAVLVQPSVYGTDNSAMLDLMAAPPWPLRGVVVVEEEVSDVELQRMHKLGVRGIRFNIVDVPVEERGKLPIDRVRRMAARIAPLGWHVQFLMHVDEFPELDRVFAGFPTDIVIDHFGYMKTAKGQADPGFRAFLRLLGAGRCWVKFTGPYRISGGPFPFDDVTPFARALVAANPDRVVWGTDWPHPKHEGRMPNDGEMCERLAEWIPDAGNLRKALVDNPAKLYGF